MRSGTKQRNGVVSVSLVAVLALTAATGCGHMMTMLHGGPDRPPASEFGLGPRTSGHGLYSVTLEPDQPLAKRKLQKVRVLVRTIEGEAVEGAEMAVDGGMPQHGHGLPTKPRMTKRLGEGRYEIEGVRFNMGGWWEFRLSITGAAGADRVTFNLAL
jgi:YtkA-like